jgi:hypothetical protein
MTDNTGFRFNPNVVGSNDVHKLRIPVSNIYRMKNSFYKHLDVDEPTRNAIKLYNM